MLAGVMLTGRPCNDQIGAPNAVQEGAMNLTALVAVVATVVLVLIVIGVGIELDTERQRRERQRLAEERRLYDDARRIGRTRERGPLCDRCPYRDNI
jgi:hypothetical protein